MTCPVCNRLRFAWYATATQITTLNVAPEIVVKVRDGDRKLGDYQEALEAYRSHRALCDWVEPLDVTEEYKELKHEITPAQRRR